MNPNSHRMSLRCCYHINISSARNTPARHRAYFIYSTSSVYAILCLRHPNTRLPVCYVRFVKMIVNISVFDEEANTPASQRTRKARREVPAVSMQANRGEFTAFLSDQNVFTFFYSRYKRGDNAIKLSTNKYHRMDPMIYI